MKAIARKIKYVGLLLSLLLLLLVNSATHATQDAPEVAKVEPPNWWANHSINPVRVLIRGKNLNGARVESSSTDLQTSNVKTNAAGTYLFVDVTIDANASVGRRALKITTPQGTVDAPFDLAAPLARAGRFQGFTPDDVIYLIMPDRFSDGDATNNDPAESRGLYARTNPRAYHGGDLQGIIDHLPYLKDLGVTAIWVTPVYDNSNRSHDFDYGKNVTDYHGYGATDYYRVEEHLGTLEKFKELVERAHAMGLKIIQDQVANHTGPDHPWAVDSPTPTWYNGTVANHLNNVFDIKSVTQENPDRSRLEATLKGWFANLLPDLNQDDSETARYLMQNAVWWVSATGLDGIRQDTLPYVPRQFWADWNQALQREFPQLTTVGEVFDGRPEITAFFQGGRAQFDGIDTHLHTVFDFASYFALRDVFIRHQPMSRLTEVLNQDPLYPNARVLVTFLGNHDVRRFLGEEGASVEALKNAFTYLLTMRGTPQIYSGDEIALRGGDDPDNRRDFPGGFAGDDHNAFTADGRVGKERKVFKYVRALLHMRAQHAALRSGEMKMLTTTDNTLAFLRRAGNDNVLVVMNNSDKACEIDIALPLAVQGSTAWTTALDEAKGWRGQAIHHKIKLVLEPRDSMVLQQSRRR
ncbi:MAG: cyclomaltodextrinase N-terminal domain-containing protein [Acidobacteria bacterium]|nr:cyclomaltodextrinase N-terminal domain-containing protein [Acidobacteriota bacterium]